MNRFGYSMAIILGIVLFMAFLPHAYAIPDTDDAAATALESLNPMKERVLSILQLGRSGNETAAGPLLDLLTNPLEQDPIRANSARALAQLGSPRAEILSAFYRVAGQQTTSANLQYTILFCLGKMRATESLPFLAQSLADVDPMVRFKAIQALGSLQNPEALSLLDSHLDSEADPMVRAETTRAMGRTGLPEAVPPLLRALRSDPSPLVRLNAVLMLKRFKTLSPAARTVLSGARKDPSSLVRKALKGIVP